MVTNDWLCQFLANMTEPPVERPAGIETTALGASCLAGLYVGVFADLDAVAATGTVPERLHRRMESLHRARLYRGWRSTVAVVRPQVPEQETSS